MITLTNGFWILITIKAVFALNIKLTTMHMKAETKLSPWSFPSLKNLTENETK